MVTKIILTVTDVHTFGHTVFKERIAFSLSQNKEFSAGAGLAFCAS
jgi:hypothetical protein